MTLYPNLTHIYIYIYTHTLYTHYIHTIYTQPHNMREDCLTWILQVKSSILWLGVRTAVVSSDRYLKTSCLTVNLMRSLANTDDSSTYLISWMRDTRRDGITMEESDFLLSGTCDTDEIQDMISLLHSEICVTKAGQPVCVRYLVTLPAAAPASPLSPGSAAGGTTGPIFPDGSEKYASDNWYHSTHTGTHIHTHIKTAHWWMKRLYIY